ncbi:site-specific integrase [Agriterribacter sp.]|uniref:site-specific integrase n=1 Tax=Agriterribacter sp. TaxID=2821509 RepID=UPI002B514B69|nr:site-specific integrase [Agriterribacter sp.]HRO46236.1 site-specific integrase [Agriterribacter sp.]HRQ18483.1 site-specific integrase [Agriterribacter sp.]
MLEQSFGLNFFLKTPENQTKIRFVYVRVTVDGVPKDKSTKRKWDVGRWDQETERAIGTKEDARALNYFLDSLTTKINQYKTDLLNQDITIASQLIADYIGGKTISKAKVLEEFQTHNDELAALVKKGQYAEGTHERYVTARSHVKEFIRFKYGKDDLEFRELNYEFVQSYDIYLRTVRDCANNTALKYISNFKKIILRAVKKEIIPKDPFTLFSRKKTKIKKKPLTSAELYSLETKALPNERLCIVRDVSVFQCYTGLAYCDVYDLKPEDIGLGEDKKYWIFISRKKTNATCDIPLLPKALEIMEKYKDDPICIKRGSILPVRSNQKMNAYLKEIQALCNINLKYKLDTHRLRRTFASTVALKNGVPIHIVKELLGHSTVKQTEDYAITVQETVSKEMTALSEKLSQKAGIEDKAEVMSFPLRLENELNTIKAQHGTAKMIDLKEKLVEIEKNLNELKGTIS